MHIVCLDLEGVLVPEIWIAFAECTGRPGFARTTRDEPDYDRLMRDRIALLAQYGLRLSDLQATIGQMAPLPGARDFLDRLRERFQVVILSDTFYEFADPLMQQLGRPTLFCHRLSTDAQGFVTGYRLRMPDAKRAAVRAFQQLNFKVIAAGDSYNDVAMLEQADAGFLLHAPQAIAARFPALPAHRGYAELRASIDAAAARLDTTSP